MTGQTRSIAEILTDRLSVIQSIAAANVEHMRLNQIARGMMILAMKEEEDGTEDAEQKAERARNEAAVERCMDEINAFEATLSRLDQELEIATKEEE